MLKFLKYPILFLLVTMLAAACNTKDEVPPPGDDNLYFVEFMVNSDTVYYEDGEDNYGNGPGIASHEDSIGRLHSQFTTFIRSALDPDYEDNIITIQMVKFLTDTNPPAYNISFLLFDEGNYAYGSWNEDTTTVGVDGAVITYTDNSGKVWSSDLRYGTQETWADFEITDHKAVDEEQFGAKTKGTFDCRVFDGLGGHLDLTSGRFHARTIYPE